MPWGLTGAPKTTLRAVPPTVLPPSTGGVDRASGFVFDPRAAVRANIADLISLPVTPTGSSAPNVGAAGSEGNAGNIAGAAGNIGYVVETVRNWQATNPQAAMFAKIGLPIAGVFLFTKGHPYIGVAVGAISIPLWMK